MPAQNITITKGDAGISVKAPYHDRMPKLARAAGGKFNGTTKEWTFPYIAERRVYEILNDVYGWTGQAESGMPLTHVRLTLLEEQGEAFGRPNQVLYAGKLAVCEARGRDTGVRFRDGVIHTGGPFPKSGGSRQYPRVLVGAGLAVECEIDMGMLDGLDAKQWRVEYLV